MVALRFEVRFHTPFRVASGVAGDSADTTIDWAAPLPASSLKGVMLSAARDLLRLPPDWVKEVFGADRQPSPWSWSDAVPSTRSGDVKIRTRARIRIEPDTGTVAPGALAYGQEMLAHRAEFTIERSGWIPPANRSDHQHVIVASARAVTAVGGDRRRGLGWVSVFPLDPAWTPQSAAELARVLPELTERNSSR